MQKTFLTPVVDNIRVTGYPPHLHMGKKPVKPFGYGLPQMSFISRNKRTNV
jgi:hypothetical protein